MGGTVAIAIKRKGKITTRMLSKSAAAGLCRGDFYEGHGPFWDQWKQGQNIPFAPEGYGLVVIDMENKWATCIQGYAYVEETNIRLNRSEDIQDFKRLWEQERVKKVMIYAPTADIPLRIACGKTRPNFEYVMERVFARCSDDCSLILNIKPPKGWKVEQFSEDPEGWTELIDVLQSKHIEISRSDLPLWDTYLQDHIDTASPIDHLKAQHLAEDLEQSTPKVSSSSRAIRM